MARMEGGRFSKCGFRLSATRIYSTSLHGRTDGELCSNEAIVFAATALRLKRFQQLRGWRVDGFLGVILASAPHSSQPYLTVALMQGGRLQLLAIAQAMRTFVAQVF